MLFDHYHWSPLQQEWLQHIYWYLRRLKSSCYVGDKTNHCSEFSYFSTLLKLLTKLMGDFYMRRNKMMFKMFFDGIRTRVFLARVRHLVLAFRSVQWREPVLPYSRANVLLNTLDESSRRGRLSSGRISRWYFRTLLVRSLANLTCSDPVLTVTSS